MVVAVALELPPGHGYDAFALAALEVVVPMGLAAELAQVPPDARDGPADGTGRREQYIVTRFGASSTAYYQHLNRLLDSHAALAAYPVLINRLRRIRDARNAQRGH